MNNGYVLADTNSLVYAYHAGGPELIDKHIRLAAADDRKFATTKTVRDEIEKGPLSREILQYIADKQIDVVSAPITEHKLEAGLITSTSSGEVSMLEIAAREQEAGRVARIWADDKYFDSDQIRSCADARVLADINTLIYAYHAGGSER